MIEMKYSGTGFGTKELNAEQKPGLSFLGHFGISPTATKGSNQGTLLHLMRTPESFR
jgi:hypothetical protein